MKLVSLETFERVWILILCLPQIVFLSVIALTAGVKIKSKHNPITQQNTDLFKYSPNDPYSLPDDIDDDSDKPPSDYKGDSKAAKISQLQNLNSGRGKFKVSWVVFKIVWCGRKFDTFSPDLWTKFEWIYE